MPWPLLHTSPVNVRGTNDGKDATALVVRTTTAKAQAAVIEGGGVVLSFDYS